MKKNTVVLLIILLSLSFFSCNQSQVDNKQESQVAPVFSSDSGSNELKFGQIKPDSSTRKMIKTSSFRFEVKNVATSSISIRDLINQSGGFIVSSNLETTVNQVDRGNISEDSILERSYYTVSNHLSFRVPNQRLDEVSSNLVQHSAFLNHWNFLAEDVTIRYASNGFSQNRFDASTRRNEHISGSRNNSVGESSFTDDNILNRQLAADQFKIANMDLGDKIAYSTIDVELYQPELVRSQILPVHIPIKSFQPGFWSDMKGSVYDGWLVIQQLIVFVTKFWSIALLMVLIFLGYKRFIRKFRPVMNNVK